MKLLNDNRISLEAICEVDDRELYRFITEELIYHEVDDMKIPGMMSCFIYEEFYPNHELDIKNDCSTFFYFFLQKKYDDYAHHLTDKLKGNSYLKHFSDSFSTFDKNGFDITSVQIVGKNALVLYTADFVGTIEGINSKQHFCGKGEMELNLGNDYWYIDRVQFPEPKYDL